MGDYSISVEFQFCKMKQFWRSVAQQSEYTQQYKVAHLKMVKMINFMLHGFLFTKIKNDLRTLVEGFPGGAVVKNPPANARGMGLSPGLGRSHMPQSN